MGIIAFYIVFGLLVASLCDKYNDSPKRRIRKMDADPNCTIKSNEWHRLHDNK
jgi:hypothetical protein